MMNLFKKLGTLLAAMVFFSISAHAADQTLHFDTTLGGFDVELFNDQAPITVANFLSYVDSGFYAQTIFHRIVPGFVAQGGGLTADMTVKPTNAPIKNEAGNGLSNLRGTLSMARTSDIDSATSQFFINFVDNTALDHTGETADTFGYAVFGKVTAGMDIVDQMATVPLHNVSDDYQNVPVTSIVVLSVTRTN